jgi:hypothetical protein
MSLNIESFKTTPHVSDDTQQRIKWSTRVCVCGSQLRRQQIKEAWRVFTEEKNRFREKTDKECTETN